VIVYVDESGDLGFDKLASEFFVVSYVILVNTTSGFLAGKISRLLRNINLAKKPRGKISEFKFSNDDDKTRIKFLNKINSYDVKIGVVAISKDSVKQHLQKDLVYLYNFIVVDNIMKTIVNDYLNPYDPFNRILFVVDRSLSAKRRKQFNDYADKKAEFLTKQRNWNMEVIVTIRHENSEDTKLLQVADYVASSTSLKLRGNSKYYDLIKNKISHKDKWDWKNKIQW